MSMTRPWLQFSRERLALPACLLLAGGFAVSGAMITGRDPDPVSTVLIMQLLLLLLIELRLMDEYKDRDKDAVAHPERPLPRGLITPGSLRRMIGIIYAGMLLLVPVLALSGLRTAALWFLLTLWCGLMYREFFAPDRLNARPWLYALTHQLLVPLMVLFAVAMHGGPTGTIPVAGLALMALGGFFNYEVCRKLDPAAHPVLGNYRTIYGRGGAALMSLAALAVAALGTMMAGPGPGMWLFPVQLLCALSLGLLWIRPGAWKGIEILATLGLVLHIWAGVFYG